MFKNFPVLLTGPLARRPERPLTRFIPRSLRALDPGGDWSRYESHSFPGPLTATLTESGTHAACVQARRLSLAMLKCPTAPSRHVFVQNRFRRQTWSPIQLHFDRYLRVFWLNAPFHGAFALSRSGRRSATLVARPRKQASFAEGSRPV